MVKCLSTMNISDKCQRFIKRVNLLRIWIAIKAEKHFDWERYRALIKNLKSYHIIKVSKSMPYYTLNPDSKGTKSLLKL